MLDHGPQAFDSLGAKVVAVNDLAGTLYMKNGIPVRQLKEYIMNNGTIEGSWNKNYSAGRNFCYRCGCNDTAALENQICQEEALNLKVKLVAEGANGPVNNAADKILNEKGIEVLPDILANSGGVIVIFWMASKSF